MWFFDCLTLELIRKYMDGLLSEVEQGEAEKHFEECRICKNVLENELVGHSN